MMEWQKLISNKRLGQEYRHIERHDDRTEFKRDYDRLIFSAPFRRMQNKTQVFPLPGSIFVHNRLTHSLEVASVGMSLGNDIAHELIKRHPELENSFYTTTNAFTQSDFDDFNDLKDDLKATKIIIRVLIVLIIIAFIAGALFFLNNYFHIF